MTTADYSLVGYVCAEEAGSVVGDRLQKSVRRNSQVRNRPLVNGRASMRIYGGEALQQGGWHTEN